MDYDVLAIRATAAMPIIGRGRMDPLGRARRSRARSSCRRARGRP
jgi:hypothetical protein